MNQTHTFQQKIQQLLYILLPILVTQIALFSMSLFDTIMSGQVSSADLAGVAIGSSIWFPISAGLTGILLSITPIVAQLNGANRQKEVPFTVIQGLYLATSLTVLVIIVGSLSITGILSLMKLEPAVRHIAYYYLFALSFGIFPLFLYTVLRSFMDALGQTRATMLITLTSLPINVLLNYVLIFGKWGFPALGGIGAGIASAITYWCLLFLALYVSKRHEVFARLDLFRKLYRISFPSWSEQLKIGLPIGFAIFFETSIFAAVTLLMSQFNTATIAAHQAALNFASLLYMVPFSISMALTIVIGFEIGAGKAKDAKQYSYLGIGMAVTMSLIGGSILFLFNEQVASMYTKEMEVLILAQKFLIYAIFFQFSDAIAAPIQGALRGYKDVNTTFVVALVSYWVVGLPIGLVLANYTDFGAFGYWMGLIAGLAFGAIFLFWRLCYIQKNALVKVKMGR